MKLECIECRKIYDDKESDEPGLCLDCVIVKYHLASLEEKK